MPLELSFAATPEAAAVGRHSAREITEAVRKSLINIGGLTYPNMQAAINWPTPASTKERSTVFEFTRQQPRGSLTVFADLAGSLGLRVGEQRGVGGMSWG